MGTREEEAGDAEAEGAEGADEEVDEEVGGEVEKLLVELAEEGAEAE